MVQIALHVFEPDIHGLQAATCVFHFIELGEKIEKDDRPLLDLTALLHVETGTSLTFINL